MPVDPAVDPVSLDPGFDHPIFSASIQLIRQALGPDDAFNALPQIHQDLLLRLIHSSGDLSLLGDVRFSTGACEAGAAALAAGAPLLTDTAMAAAAVAPMALRTFGNSVCTVLDWAPPCAPAGSTRTAAGMARALIDRPGAVVLIGSAPTALDQMMQLVAKGDVAPPALVIGMPVGFVGVVESKRRLAASALPHILLEGSRGGAGLAGAAANALLRHAWLQRLGQHGEP